MIMETRTIAPMICDDVTASILRESTNVECTVVTSDSHEYKDPTLTANEIIHSVNIYQLVSGNPVGYKKKFETNPLQNDS